MFQLNIRKAVLAAVAAVFSALTLATGVPQAEAKVTVRDHRTTIQVKDHRPEQRPIVRDHRTEPSPQQKQ